MELYTPPHMYNECSLQYCLSCLTIWRRRESLYALAPLLMHHMLGKPEIIITKQTYAVYSIPCRPFTSKSLHWLSLNKTLSLMKLPIVDLGTQRVTGWKVLHVCHCKVFYEMQNAEHRSQHCITTVIFHVNGWKNWNNCVICSKRKETHQTCMSGMHWHIMVQHNKLRWCGITAWMGSLRQSSGMVPAYYTVLYRITWTVFRYHWIGCDAPLQWPPRSPDVSLRLLAVRSGETPVYLTKPRDSNHLKGVSPPP